MTINADEKGEGLYRVNDMKGQYVKRIAPCLHCWDGKNGKDPCAYCNGTGMARVLNRVYQVIGYNRNLRKWELQDTTDIHRCVYVKSNGKVWAGFTY